MQSDLMKSTLGIIFCLLTFFGSTALSEADDPLDYEDFGLEEVNQKNPDPFEKFNRGVFAFNKGVDNVVIRPSARMYQVLFPSWGKARVNSFLSNLKEPLYAVNSLLQRNPDQIFISMFRFLINSTIGIGGLFDVASQAGLKSKRLDFDSTMAYYGVQHGPYMMIPILGPSTMRGAVGGAADMAGDPLRYIMNRDFFIGTYIADGVNLRERMLESTDAISKISMDEYAMVRSMYLQNLESRYK